MYTMNGSQLLWKGKPARLAKGATGRRITDTMATDGHTLYFAQKRVKLPAGINLDRLRIRVFNENPVNLLGAVLDDGESVWQLGLLAKYIWPLPGAAFEAVQRFPETAGVYRDDHLRDSSHVWYRGELIDGLAADKAQVVDDSIVSDGEHVWIFGKRSEVFRRKDITPIGEGLTRTDDALLLENAENRSFSVVLRRDRCGRRAGARHRLAKFQPGGSGICGAQVDVVAALGQRDCDGGSDGGLADPALEIGKRRVGKECSSRWSPYH